METSPKEDAEQDKCNDENYVSPVRSFTMSQVKGTDTSIEVVFRKALWHSGIRYRKNYKALPGKPDIAITRHKIAVFCDGEFWHGKDWHLVRGKLRTRREFWIRKIERNIERDTSNERKLMALGWTILRFWGRDIEKNLDLCIDDVRDAIFQARVGPAVMDLACELEEYDGYMPTEGEDPYCGE